MKYLEYKNGDKMPILGLGTWKSAPGDVYAAVKEAIKIGYRHIDCAAIYGNEKEVGKAISESIAENIVVREELWITSKLWSNAHGRNNVIPALKQTLADLQLDYVDLYEIHWPVAFKTTVLAPEKPEDFAINEYPIPDTWKGMEDAVNQGLTRHIGGCNFKVAKLEELLLSSSIKPEMMQVEIHPYLQQNELVDFCEKNGILVTAYAPLGSSDRPAGMKAKDEPVLLQDELINSMAQRKGISPAQILLGWLTHRGIVAIPKSVNPVRLKQNYESVEIVLSHDEMGEINGLNKGRRYVDGSFLIVDNGPINKSNLW
jgi:alcohol dehydrogenase (NADP+)